MLQETYTLTVFMKLSNDLLLTKEASLQESLNIVLLLIFTSVFFFSCGKEDKIGTIESVYTEEDVQTEKSLKSYLEQSYTCSVDKVFATESMVQITGKYAGEGTFYLAEIPPFLDVTKIDKIPYEVVLKDHAFVVTMDRFTEIDGVHYDRILSKWAILEKNAEKVQLVSHARYADAIPTFQDLPPILLKSKKGLGGLIPNQYMSDLTLLGISSATINICITQFMYLTPQTGCIEHTYGGKTYYMNKEYIENVLDRTLLAATQKHNISVAAIILLEPMSRCADPQLGALLQHPDNNGGIYTMPNMTNAESVNCYAAALDFLAKRYCRIDNRYGRIAHWIMHNEVDGGIDWANMGVKPVTVFTDTYIKSMRMCYNIVRQYDAHAEVFASFSHSWTTLSNPGWYTSKEIIDLLNVYSQVEGDFQWGLAYHSYSQDLTNPCVWLDPNATFSMNTKFITFKNLEVLSKWALSKENKYKGTIKRSVWLSEAGVNSPTYSDEDLQKQAASLAYAWKKINALEGIDGFQWHNWFDHPGDGACFGLRKYLDETYNGEAKPVWSVYQKAGTHEEDEYFEQFLPVIGISNWNIIEQF